MTTIDSREDIRFLVHAFYAKVRKDKLLGPIFDKNIAEDQWPEHLEKLSDFWETNLFGVSCFKGSPTAKHIKVDAGEGHTIEQLHFGRWLNLWFETIDEHFEGEVALKAKQAARKMSTGQFWAIWKSRPENQENRQ